MVLAGSMALVILNSWACSIILDTKATFWLSDSSEKYYPHWWKQNQDVPLLQSGLESVSIVGDRYKYTPQYIDGSDAHETGVIVTASGWPVRTFIATRVFENSTTVSLTNTPAWYHAGIILLAGSPPDDMGRHVPLVPIWKNFFVCLVILWMLINIVLRSYALAIRRTRHGAQVCVKCRYPIDDRHGRCPECGNCRLDHRVESRQDT